MKFYLSVIAFILLIGNVHAQNYDTLTEVRVVSPRKLTVSGRLRDI